MMMINMAQAPSARKMLMMKKKRVQANQALSPTVRKGERKVLVCDLLGLYRLRHTVGREILPPGTLSSLLLRHPMGGAHPEPASVLRVSRTSSQQGWCHFGHVLDDRALLSAMWLQDAQQRWSTYRASRPHPLGWQVRGLLLP